MDQTTITRLTRNGIRQLQYSSTDITAMTLLGVLQFGQVIKSCAPSYFKGRKILSSYTHVFDWPSDCESIINVWDTLTNATTITGATNASPINIESASHGLSDDDIVLVTGVLGNTASNGTFKVTSVDSNNVTLNGSTGNAAYTSGGKILKWSSTFRRMNKKPPRDQSLQSRYNWYPEGKTIVVDYINYTYDLIADYIQRPDAITDIPTEYHMGLVGWNVMNLIEIPRPDAEGYQDLVSSYKANAAIYQNTLESIRANFMPNTEPVLLNDMARWDII
jgi:hypothetical protein